MYMYVRIYEHIHTRKHAYMYFSIHVLSTYICLYMLICMCVHMYLSMYGLCMFTCAYIACVYAYGFILARMYICIGDGPIVATFRWADSLCVHGCAFACTCCLSKCLLDVRRRQRQQPGRACPASLLRRNLQTINFLTRSGLMSFTARNVAGGIASNWLSRNSSPRPRCVRVRCVCLCALLIG